CALCAMRSRSIVRGALRTPRRRPRRASIASSSSSSACGARSVDPATTALRKRGDPGGASTGSVSMNELTRTTSITRRRSWLARRRCSARSPGFEPSATRALLLDIDGVRQLVDVVRGAREVLAKVLAGGGDRLDDPLGELAVLEANGQLRGDLVPEAGGHFLVDPFVAEDHEALLLGGDEEKDAVAQRGFGHAEALERALGDGAQVAAGDLWLHVDANLAGGQALRLLNRGNDARLVELCKKLLLIHPTNLRPHRRRRTSCHRRRPTIRRRSILRHRPHRRQTSCRHHRPRTSARS